MTGFDIPPWFALAAAIALVVGAIGLGANLRARRRMRQLTAALATAARGRLAPISPPLGTRGRLQYVPAPEPFAALTVELATGSGLWMGLRSARKQSITFRGLLPSKPRAELVWHTRQPPDRALGSAAEPQLWGSRLLIDGRSEFAVRGENPAALEHAFLELQRRFNPRMRHVTVLADAQPQVVVELAADGLNSEDIPTLVAAVRALGRTAQVG